MSQCCHDFCFDVVGELRTPGDHCAVKSSVIVRQSEELAEGLCCTPQKHRYAAIQRKPGHRTVEFSRCLLNADQLPFDGFRTSTETSEVRVNIAPGFRRRTDVFGKTSKAFAGFTEECALRV